MNRGEIYRTQEKVPERGYNPGFYVVLSRNFVSLQLFFHADIPLRS